MVTASVSFNKFSRGGGAFRSPERDTGFGPNLTWCDYRLPMCVLCGNDWKTQKTFILKFCSTPLQYIAKEIFLLQSFNYVFLSINGIIYVSVRLYLRNCRYCFSIGPPKNNNLWICARNRTHCDLSSNPKNCHWHKWFVTFLVTQHLRKV